MSAPATVLLCDDGPATHALYETRLEVAGFAPLFAENGEAALWGIAAAPPAAVIVDLGRPPLDGWLVLADLGRRDPRPRLVAISVRATDRDRAFALGADGFATGPGDLVAALHRAFATARAAS